MSRGCNGQPLDMVVMLDVIILGSIDSPGPFTACFSFSVYLSYCSIKATSAKKSPKKSKNIIMYFAKGLFIQIALQSTSPVAVHNQLAGRRKEAPLFSYC